MPKVVIVGAGRIGMRLARVLSKEERNEITIIEKDRERAELASKDLDVLVVNGDATNRSILKEIGIDDADVLITTTAQDQENLLICEIAKRLGVPKLIALVRDPENSEIFQELGVIPINETHLIVDGMVKNIQMGRRESVIHTFNDGDYAIISYVVGEGSEIIGSKAKDLSFSKSILCIEKGDGGIVHPKDAQVEEGDKLFLLVRMEELHKIREMINGKG